MPPIGSAAKWLMRGLGGVGGATYGVQTAEKDEDKLLRGVAGAVGGGIVAPAALAAAGRGIKDFTYFSMLSSPDTIARGNLGALGGAITAATELGLEGIATIGTKGGFQKIKNAGRILKSLTTEGVGIYGRALKASPTEFRAMQRKYMGTPKVGAEIEQYTGGIGVGRLFGAPDMAAVNAMRKGGFSAAEAKRMTLTGDPTSGMGKYALSMQQSAKKYGKASEILATQIAPFARVGILGLEKGLQRMPLIGLAGKGRTATQKGVQQLTGLGAGVAGYHADEKMDPRLGMVLGPLAGPAFLPFTAGRELKRQLETGKPLTQAAVSGAGETFKEMSPLGFQPLGILSSAGTELPRRLVPSAVADIASAIDPAFERERSVSRLEDLKTRGEYEGDPLLGPLLARIPGLREQLPETYAPVDVFGRQRYKSPEIIEGAEDDPLLRGLLRTMAPSLRTAEPAAMPQSNPLFRQLRELGIELQAPSANVNLPGTGLPLEQTQESARAVQEMGGLSPQIAVPIVIQIMNQPQFRNMPQAKRNYIAKQLLQRIRSRISRAMGSARLATALSHGAGMPTVLDE